MKKFLSLLLAVPMLAMLASCDDDDTKDIPDVNISIEYTGGSLSDGTMYVVQGDELDITALKVTPAAGTGQATLANVTYFLDGYPFFATGISPWGVTIDTSDIAVGSHTLSVRAQILQVDKSLGFGIFNYPIDVVSSSSDLPSDSGSGSDTPAQTISETAE